MWRVNAQGGKWRVNFYQRVEDNLRTLPSGAGLLSLVLLSLATEVPEAGGGLGE